jgi:NDP-4-keto-2,6-dideoxyhexose 3-C-methyltransferase
MSYTAITACRICGNANLVPVLELGDQVLTGRFPRPDDPDPPSGPLTLVKCHDDRPGVACGLLQLAHNHELTEMYGETYGYRSSVTRTMRTHLKAKIERLIQLARPRPGDLVLDIGCNDGTSLSFYEGTGVVRFGIDPSAAKFKGEYPADISLIVDFFARARLEPLLHGRRFKIITAIAMFYDLPAPLDFLRDVRALIADDGLIELEQAYMPAMLEQCAYDGICHEHLNYYGLAQLAWLAERAGLKIVEIGFNDINGGSFRVVLAPLASPHPPDSAAIEAALRAEAMRGLHTLEPYRRFQREVQHHSSAITRFFHEARRNGKLVLGYGASTKGNVIIQHSRLTRAEIPAIVERYPPKFGLTAPGSRIPIISEDEGRAMKPDFFFVFPWHFRTEIIEREQDFINAGGALVFPLPRFTIVSRYTVAAEVKA